jgi:hypothetical protein
MKNQEVEILNALIQVKGKMYVVELNTKQSYSRFTKMWLNLKALKESLHNKAVKAICDYKVKQILTAIDSHE